MKTLFVSLLVLLSVVSNAQSQDTTKKKKVLIICAKINGSKKLVPFNPAAIKFATELKLTTCGNGKNNMRYLETAIERGFAVKSVSVTRTEFKAARAKLRVAMNTGNTSNWFK